MANLSDESEEGVSLFPMFNILACTLGVMVFVLATVATVSLGADKAVEFVAVGEIEGVRSDVPNWLEWDGAHLVAHPSGEEVLFDRDLRAMRTYEQTYRYISEQLAGTRLGARLAAIATVGDEYVILLVRPSGFGSLAEIRGYIRLLGVEVVEEPIDQDWARILVR